MLIILIKGRDGNGSGLSGALTRSAPIRGIYGKKILKFGAGLDLLFIAASTRLIYLYYIYIYIYKSYRTFYKPFTNSSSISAGNLAYKVRSSLNSKRSGVFDSIHLWFFFFIFYIQD